MVIDGDNDSGGGDADGDRNGDETVDDNDGGETFKKLFDKYMPHACLCRCAGHAWCHVQFDVYRIYCNVGRHDTKITSKIHTRSTITTFNTSAPILGPQERWKQQCQHFPTFKSNINRDDDSDKCPNNNSTIDDINNAMPIVTSACILLSTQGRCRRHQQKHFDRVAFRLLAVMVVGVRALAGWFVG